MKRLSRVPVTDVSRVQISYGSLLLTESSLSNTMNNIVPFTRHYALSEHDIRREMMESLMLSMVPAEWYKTIEDIVQTWSEE